MKRRQSSPPPPGLEILNLRQLAAYLMVSEKTIYRMIESRRIPALRVGAHWRFRRSDIDAWLGEQVRKVEVEGQRALVDEIAELEAPTIGALLEPENVWIGVRAGDRDSLIRALVAKAELDPHVDREKLVASILRREALSSTAMLDDVALPHPVTPEEFHFSKKRILLATLAAPCDFRDPLGHRPRLVAILLARSLQGHLLAMSRALQLFGDSELVAELRASRTPRELIDHLIEREARSLGRGQRKARR